MQFVLIVVVVLGHADEVHLRVRLGVGLESLEVEHRDRRVSGLGGAEGHTSDAKGPDIELRAAQVDDHAHLSHRPPARAPRTPSAQPQAPTSPSLPQLPPPGGNKWQKALRAHFHILRLTIGFYALIPS